MNDRNSKKDAFSRREFLGATGSGTALAWAGSGSYSNAGAEGPLARRKLGKTGVKVPILGLGTAPAGTRSRKEAAWFFHKAIDAGVTYLDTAPEFAGYGIAQKALGDVLKHRRPDAFVVTKCFEPDGEKALALLKRNLKELQTDRVDLVYAHSIGDAKMDLDIVLGSRGVMHALEKARRDGLCRFIGISGHNRPEKFLKVMDDFDIQVMMNAVNYVIRHVYNFEERVWPEARRRDIGLVAMKVLGGMYRSEADPQCKPKAKGGRIRGARVRSAIRYALDLPAVSTAVLGCYNLHELHQAMRWVRAFQPLSGDERQKLLAEGQRISEEWGAVHGPVR